MFSGRRRALTLLLLLACLVGVAVYAWSRFQLPRHIRGADAHIALLHNLGEVETGLAAGMSPETMARLADNIQSEIQEHPLPPGDEFEFGGQLIVRYLRTLSALEGYRRLKLATDHMDPLDPKSARANTQAIETREKCRVRLQRAVEDLRSRLSNSK